MVIRVCLWVCVCVWIKIYGSAGRQRDGLGDNNSAHMAEQELISHYEIKQRSRDR